MKAAEVRLSDYLQPEWAKHPSPEATTTPRTVEGAVPPARYQLRAQTGREPRTPAWVEPLGVMAGGGAVAFGSLVLMGVAQHRRTEEPESHDVATEDTYGLYGFELEELTAQNEMDAACTELEGGIDSLEARLDALEEQTNGTLITARLHSELNLCHLGVLAQMGQNPLPALTYPAAGTYLSLADCEPALALAA